MNFEKILVYGLLAVLIGGLILMIAGGLAGGSGSGLNYENAVAAENPNNLCATPAGYTDESWREHMGHHPDRYAQCLK